ncbi:hypothetical protein D1O33_26625 (plasmid) [Rhodococcus rhodochrous]|uniref:hypothetical protein n=1 Tax=Rhodococcus rhodochrous TaxID=1829 RepID=UPI00132F4CF6|nr:hypothetical protein [Rhodococcus rhodochrous]QHG85566.1 hypothetical protein D1O33_26625 [Rhodococcus rhodochrous]
MYRALLTETGMVGLLLVATACGGSDVEATEVVSRDGLLLTVEDLPTGTQVARFTEPEQLVMNLLLDTPSDLGVPRNIVYDPVECGEQSSYADEARLSLSDVDSTSMMGAYLDDERSYLALVSDVPLDIARVADAHTGSCSTYRMNSRTITTSRLDLPPAIATENAAMLYEVSDPDNPDWANDEVFYGYASVDGYTITVVSMNGVEFESEFTEFFTKAVLKARNR